MSWSHIQDTPGSNGRDAGDNVSSLTATAFASANTIGNVVVVFLWAFNWDSNHVTSATDNAQTPNTYKKIAEGQQGNYSAIFAAKILSLPASGNLRPQVNIASGTLSHVRMCCSEFSNGSIISETSTSATGNSASPATGNISTVAPNDLLLAAMADFGSSQNTPVTPPTSFTSVGQQASGSGDECGQGCYQILSGGSTVTNLNTTWTNLTSGSNPWSCCIAALYPAAFQASENLGLTDVFTRGSGQNSTRSLSDNLALSDSFADLVFRNRGISDNVALSESLLAIAARNRQWADSLGLTDLFLQRSSWSRLLQDSLGLTDNFANSNILHGIQITDAIGMIDLWNSTHPPDRRLVAKWGAGPSRRLRRAA